MSEHNTQSANADVNDYFQLLKPRVMSLVIFTAFVGVIAAPGDMHPIMAFVSVLLIAIGAGASGALNMWYDADIDQDMDRTKGRPVPAGKVSADHAKTYGMILSFGSVFLMGILINVTSAVLLALTIFFYVVIYTIWLKRRTPQNIVIGGAAGAFPPMIGWAAVTDSVTLESLVLFGIIFIWTPPHFFALSLFISNDYERVKVPMMPVVHGDQATRNNIIVYSLLLAPFAVLPYFMGFAGLAYGVVTAMLGLIFVYYALCISMKREGAEKRLFLFSIFYLFAVFATLALERIILGWIS
ncbi:heme o synthase [Temperatibacter marinus]|uniref:Protoheme IX farnesyltransferase n=1 Tax=Temperatibacter marinus TaxID=1456591 RepID=A0AA52ECJ6_9PROT|nr:heme o synthase [Temperatibacter marinus]WND02912.1 heme o synthase [Temperatibacter marinus]